MFEKLFWVLVASFLVTRIGPLDAQAQESPQFDSVQEIRGLLESIHPYLPSTEVKAEIDLFGSTSMDRMAHGWATGFQKFHPDAKFVISAEGSETVFDHIAQSPTSIAMLSRPVSESDLSRLKELGMKQPVAVMVAREALGVFVNQASPLEAIDYETLMRIFCAPGDPGTPTWAIAGLEGDYQTKPIVTVGRGAKSGTRTYLKNYVFRNQTMRVISSEAATNYGLVSEVAKDPNAIGIGGIRCGGHQAKLLKLKANGTVIPNDERSMLLGRYPLMRPFCLVIDMGQQGDIAAANREFVRYAITQAGQTEAMLAGLFPFDPPTLRAQEEKLGFKTSVGSTPFESSDASVKSTSRDAQPKR